jgi:hypothetical protein
MLSKSLRQRASVPLTIVGSVVVVALLVLALADKRDEFSTALGSASLAVLAAAALLQVVALVSRTEAWHACVAAAGATVGRRPLYRASGFGSLATLVNGQVAVAARIAALRRSAPEETPRIPALIGAEVPIVAVEAALAALTSFTLVIPLGLPWWLPFTWIAAVGGIVGALMTVAHRRRRGFWNGLAVLRGSASRARVVGLILIAVFAQIARNWVVLHAVGVDASVFDATALLIGLVALSQLPIGPSVGAAAAVIILGPHGVAAAAAAGVLLTVTGTAGSLGFALWAGADLGWSASVKRRLAARTVPAPGPG